MKIEQCPELADLGYWYVVGVVISEEGGRSPSHIPGGSWWAWYAVIDDIEYAAVRTPDPVVGVDTLNIPVVLILEAAGYFRKPYGRIGGR